MRVAVLGGTRFIGFAITRTLHEAGHQVIVVHRGATEPPELPPVEHVHIDRRSPSELKDAIRGLRADAIVDCLAMTRRDAETAVEPMGEVGRLVVLSSFDVYRAYSSLLAGEVTDPVPLSEESALRPERYPLKAMGERFADYDKIDVEEVYLGAGATILRLPMVYGERDPQRREEPILRRVRAGRRLIPVGTGSWLSSRCYVGDVAAAVPVVLGRDDAGGEVFNVCERSTWPAGLHARKIIEAAGAHAELVRVPDELLPPDLQQTGSMAQHLLGTSAKLQDLGWGETDPEEAVRRSVEWHLANPPDGPDPGFDQDDEALAAGEDRDGAVAEGSSS
jgi:nucleoside-diphosphate-sugar epimerase